jgi:membrane protease YdiL (CAAX protease family)
MLSEKPWNREVILLLLAGILVCWCLGMLVGILLEQFLPLDAFAKKSFYRFVVNTVTFDVAVIFLVHQFLKLHGTGWSDFLGLNKPQLRRALLFAIIVAILVLPVVLTLNGWLVWAVKLMGKHPPPEEPAMKVLKSAVSPGQQIYFGITAIIFAPVAEESLFRGILYPFIKQLGYPRVALWITSLVFGAIHMNVVVFLPLTFLGLVLVFVYEKTDKLIAPIATHAFFNAVNFFFSVFESELTRWLHRFWS